jgi:hypothetical protein
VIKAYNSLRAQILLTSLDDGLKIVYDFVDLNGSYAHNNIANFTGSYVMMLQILQEVM